MLINITQINILSTQMVTAVTSRLLKKEREGRQAAKPPSEKKQILDDLSLGGFAAWRLSPSRRLFQHPAGDRTRVVVGVVTTPPRSRAGDMRPGHGPQNLRFALPPPVERHVNVALAHRWQ